MEPGRYFRIRSIRPHSWGIFKELEEKGSLTFQSSAGSDAVASFGKEALSLRRDSFWKKDLLLNRGDEAIGGFLSDMLSRGALKLHNRTYRWRPRNMSWTAWSWETTHGFPVMTIRTSPAGLARGTAEIVGNLDDEDARALALIGWYLLVITHQGFESHVRHAAGHLFKRRAAAI